MVLPFVVSRAALIAVALLGFLFLPSVRQGEFEIKSDGMIGPVMGQPQVNAYPLIRMWARWDSRWYLSIAKEGYQFSHGQESNVAFFPVYPMAVRALHAVIPLPSDAGWFLLGLVISNASLLVALAYLHRLVSLDYPRPIAARTILYLLIFPTTLFLSAFYSESLFLALVISAFYYARTRRWIAAALLATVAALCRPPGVLLAAPLAFEYFSQKQFRWREVRADFLALCLIPLGPAGYLVFLREHFGSWAVLQTTEAAWDRKLTPPWNTFVRYFQHSHSFTGYDSPVNLFFAIVFCWLAMVTCLKLRPSYAIYAVASMLFMTSWGYLMSVPRFGLVVFPLFIVPAIWAEDRRLRYLMILTSGLLAAVGMVVFSQWGWIA